MELRHVNSIKSSVHNVSRFGINEKISFELEPPKFEKWNSIPSYINKTKHFLVLGAFALPTARY